MPDDTPPLETRLEHLGKLLDGTEPSSKENRLAVPLPSLIQLSQIPEKAGDRAIKGAKHWLAEQTGDEGRAGTIIDHVVDTAPWLASALATTPASDKEADYIARYGNSYQDVGGRGQFAANYMAQTRMVDSTRKEFLALVETIPADANLSDYDNQFKRMQEPVLSQVMKSSAFHDYAPKKDAALAATMATEKERLQQENPALLAQYEQEYVPVQASKKTAYDAQKNAEKENLPSQTQPNAAPPTVPSKRTILGRATDFIKNKLGRGPDRTAEFAIQTETFELSDPTPATKNPRLQEVVQQDATLPHTLSKANVTHVPQRDGEKVGYTATPSAGSNNGKNIQL